MSNIEKYTQAFCQAFDIDKETAKKLKFQDIPAWDSVGHIALIAEIENVFDINLETDDMFNITSFDSAVKILETNYNIKF